MSMKNDVKNIRGRHTHVHDEGTWTDGCMGGCRSREEFLSFCLQSTFHEYSRGESEGDSWPFMLFSCIQFLFVCGSTTRGEKPILLAVLKVSFPFQNNMLHHLSGLLSSSPDQKKRIWWRGGNQATSWVQLWHGWFDQEVEEPALTKKHWTTNNNHACEQQD